jgi:hypothetical protein
MEVALVQSHAVALTEQATGSMPRSAGANHVANEPAARFHAARF